MNSILTLLGFLIQNRKVHVYKKKIYPGPPGGFRGGGRVGLKGRIDDGVVVFD